MAFWGVEVKPGRPYTHAPSNNARGRLHLSQATLGVGAGAGSVGGNDVVFVQCNVGDKSPVYLCALSWGNVFSCPVNAEFEEDDDVVFSVVGPRSVHLFGYYCRPSGESEPPGEDIADSEAEQSVDGSDEDNYEDSFIDDDDEPEVFSTSTVSSDEEYSMDVVKTKDDKVTHKRLKKKHQIRESNGKEVKQTSAKHAARVILSDSDSDDKCPISSIIKTKPYENGTRSNDENASTRKAELKDDGNRIVTMDGMLLAGNPEHSGEANNSEKKKKKKRRKIQQNIDENKASNATKEDISIEKELSNGLVVKDLEMGRPDSEVAVLGKKVTIYYSGGAKKEGKQFDLSSDGETFKFRLGKGKVIKGLDIGIEGMRVGDRRIITIPPSLGYGSEGNGNNVPPDSWLVYDVKLIKVR